MSEKRYGLKIIPLELREANELVARYHRHHKPTRGHKFSIGCVDEKTMTLHGACIVGRPVARMIDYHAVCEVTRLVTDGTPNACSILYAAAARVAREMGYYRIQTYILISESGVTLRAAGWTCEDGATGGRQWKHTDGKPRRTDQPTLLKQRWAKILS